MKACVLVFKKINWALAEQSQEAWNERAKCVRMHPSEKKTTLNNQCKAM